MFLYLNEKFIPEKQAQIKTNDRGFLLGDGLFETLRCYRGKPFALEAHWQRLVTGAEIINLPLPLNLTKITFIIEELLNLNKLTAEDAGVRMTISRGNAPRGPVAPSNPNPTVLIICFPIKEKQQDPLKLTFSNISRNQYSPLCQFKSLCYLENIIARQMALNAGFDDAIFLNTENQVVCATSANLFFCKENKFYTPDLSSGALPGITRQTILSLAQKLGIEIHQNNFSVDELLNADEVFISNSIIEIRSVQQINHQHFNVNPHQGITALLQQAFSSLHA